MGCRTAIGHRSRQDHPHTPDGAPAPGNPFIDKPGALPEIWAYGTRSQESLAFDPRTERLWKTEHGPRGGDELNVIDKGKNYGWPVIVHGIDYPGTAIGEGITHRKAWRSRCIIGIR